ncbi:MAG: hypothetical protein LBH98_05960 [Chitinispirillales bacterium]|jgi:hypothetical protein|nr:hypothetical protein [Chitinispirillales bacterium]
MDNEELLNFTKNYLNTAKEAINEAARTKYINKYAKFNDAVKDLYDRQPFYFNKDGKTFEAGVKINIPSKKKY